MEELFEKSISLVKLRSTGMSVGTSDKLTGTRTFDKICFDTVFGWMVLALFEIVPRYCGFVSSDPIAGRGM